MDADAEQHRLVGGTAFILFGDRRLHRDRALHGVDRAGEVGDDAVAGGVEDAAPVRRDQPVDDGAARLQPGERADLVARHQPAVAGNVGGENGGQFAFDRLNRHAGSFPAQYIDQRDRRATFQAQIVTYRPVAPDPIVRSPAGRFSPGGVVGNVGSGSTPAACLRRDERPSRRANPAFMVAAANWEVGWGADLRGSRGGTARLRRLRLFA